MNTIFLYKKLSKIVANLLYRDDFVEGDMEKVRETFVKNFYDVLGLAFNISITEEKFNKFLKETNEFPSDLQSLKFIGETSESPEAYLMVNYFFALFIGMYLECTKKDQLEKVERIIKDGGITPDQFDKIKEDYQQMMLMKKLSVNIAQV
jgi:hypothetical protein